MSTIAIGLTYIKVLITPHISTSGTAYTPFLGPLIERL